MVETEVWPMNIVSGRVFKTRRIFFLLLPTSLLGFWLGGCGDQDAVVFFAVDIVRCDMPLPLGRYDILQRDFLRHIVQRDVLIALGLHGEVVSKVFSLWPAGI